jgi:uncharacterized protein YjbI with pentapeptide repeats
VLYCRTLSFIGTGCRSTYSILYSDGRKNGKSRNILYGPQRDSPTELRTTELRTTNFERPNFERLNFERPNFERLNFEKYSTSKRTQLRTTQLRTTELQKGPNIECDSTSNFELRTSKNVKAYINLKRHLLGRVRLG